MKSSNDSHVTGFWRQHYEVTMTAAFWKVTSNYLGDLSQSNCHEGVTVEPPNDVHMRINRWLHWNVNWWSSQSNRYNDFIMGSSNDRHLWIEMRWIKYISFCFILLTLTPLTICLATPAIYIVFFLPLINNLYDRKIAFCVFLLIYERHYPGCPLSPVANG